MHIMTANGYRLLASSAIVIERSADLVRKEEQRRADFKAALALPVRDAHDHKVKTAAMKEAAFRK